MVVRVDLALVSGYWMWRVGLEDVEELEVMYVFLRRCLEE